MNNNYVSSMRATDGSIVKIEAHDALLSTTKLARAYAKIKYPDRYLIFSERLFSVDNDSKTQKVGERGIYMSLILRPSFFPSQASLLRALCASAVASALEEHTEKDIGIGWVSNLFCSGKQIGNISIEGKLDNFASYEYIIINFSISLSDDNFPARVGDLITKVFKDEGSSIPLIIAKNILNKFFALYSQLKNPAKYMDIYKNKFIMTGAKVKYNTKDGKKASGKILGINPDNCALLVETPKKEIVTIFGENNVTLPRTFKKRIVKI